jgi:hypothetical protein
MIASDSTTPRGEAPGDGAAEGPEGDSADAALTRLRGAGVEVDVRRAARVVVGICLVGLLVLVVVLFVAGANKNAQINQLRNHGVAVNVTVTGCLGLLGGSGSNPAGYACTGTFTLDGHRYRESVPGNVLRPPGTKVAAVAVPGNPPLLDTHHAVASEHASLSVFVVPTILLIVVLLLLGTLLLRRRHVRSPGAG